MNLAYCFEFHLFIILGLGFAEFVAGVSFEVAILRCHNLQQIVQAVGQIRKECKISHRGRH